MVSLIQKNEISKEINRRILLFENDISVERVAENSGQASIFFGSETSCGVQVVCKQYTQAKIKGIFREIKIFTHLEQMKRLQQGNDLTEIVKYNNYHDGLPQLLSYKLKQEGGEILLANAGASIDKWGVELSKGEKMLFAFEMLRQLIPALKKLHSLGYSHGDIKHENICVRSDSQNKLKFTLIDFGVSSKLPKLG